MGRYAGYRAERIIWVGHTKPVKSDLEFVLVPEELNDVAALALIQDYIIYKKHVVHKETFSIPRSDLRVALVAVYGVPCGIATYSEALWRAMSPRVREIKIFSEIEDGASTGSHILRCWKRGESLIDLANKINEYDPDVVFVQHEYGPFPNARHWLAFMGALAGRRVIVTLHSVYANHWDKTVVEAASKEIIVHTKSAKEALVDIKKIANKVSIIPHGCEPFDNGDKLWNIYRSDHTLVQNGFGFTYKGWEHSLEIVAELKKEYPDIFFTGLVSERWPGVHTRYIQELNAYAKKLNITENVGFIQGFQSTETLNAFLKVNRVAIFPYKDNGEHSVLGCSGAARHAMSQGVPVVASNVPLFEDLEGIVPRPSEVGGWAEAIKEIFDNPRPQLEKQNKFLEINSWEITAERYLDLI